jgi:transposase-like protein
MMPRDLEKERRWRELIARQAESGLTPPEFCRANDLKVHQFYAWRRELELRDNRQREGGSAPKKVQSLAPQFLPVQLLPSSPNGSPAIELVLRETWRVTVSPGFDPATLARVLSVLECRGC